MLLKSQPVRHRSGLIAPRQTDATWSITMYFKLYKDTAGYWRWTLYSSNGNKIADSGEGYTNKSGAESGINLVKSTSSSTPVRE